MTYNILVVEDEKPVNDLITMNLSLVGYSFDKAYNGLEAYEKIKRNKYHLILLDIMLPKMDGFELAGKVKKLNIPVIFITAKGSLSSKMEGFELGAEDYIVKPFEMLELIARIKIVLRNKYGENDEYVVDDVVMDVKQRRVTKNGVEIPLTKMEFDLFEMLIINKNIAISREKLLESVWGYDSESETRTVDVYIQKLRKKLGLTDRIKTVYKIGYRLEI
jgi:DNA-binding response OmpR family regulator